MQQHSRRDGLGRTREGKIDEGGRYNEATKTKYFDRDSACRIHVEKHQL